MFRKRIVSLLRYSTRRYCDTPQKPETAPMIPVLTGDRGINKVTLIGRAGQDAEMRGTDAHPVATVSVATSQSYRLQDGSYQQFTDWHRVSVFRNNLRDRVATSVKKGDKVYVQGSIRYSQYVNKDGQNVTATSIVADDVINLSRTFKYIDDRKSYTDEDDNK